MHVNIFMELFMYFYNRFSSNKFYVYVIDVISKILYFWKSFSDESVNPKPAVAHIYVAIFRENATQTCKNVDPSL